LLALNRDRIPCGEDPGVKYDVGFAPEADGSLLACTGVFALVVPVYTGVLVNPADVAVWALYDDCGCPLSLLYVVCVGSVVVVVILLAALAGSDTPALPLVQLDAVGLVPVEPMPGMPVFRLTPWAIGPLIVTTPCALPCASRALAPFMEPRF
jgi:hypothetical protein